MRVIVTRPQRESQRWVQDLQAQGMKALALPLIEIAPVADTTELARVWQQIASYSAVMFVSSNAVEHFFGSNQAVVGVFRSPIAIKTRAWATGPGTAQALLRAGVAPDRIDTPALEAGQFDSETLWHLVESQVRDGDRVLIVRGDTGGSGAAKPQGAGRDWLACQLTAAGAQVDLVAAYQRSAPAWTEQERQLALDTAHDGSVWLFSSTEALGNLLLALPQQNWAAARALATHPRIAQAARKAGFGSVCESRPTLADVAAALKVCPS